MQAVEQCLIQLLEGQREIHKHRHGEVSPSLILADSLLRYRHVQGKFSKNPFKNIVVIGPTQAGKSTIVNWLIGQEVAVSDALAGFTRHAQGFSLAEVTTEIQEGLSEFFTGWVNVEQDQLSAEQLAAWSLKNIKSESTPFKNTIIWDTPDFDSVSSREYRHVAMKMLAIADMLVFMVSKEKYADQSVWNTLVTLQPVKIPLLICLNKTSPSAAEEILPELDNRLQDGGLQAAVVTIPYLEDMQLAEKYEGKVRHATQELLSRTKRQDIGESVAALARLNWAQWTSEAYSENQQVAKWQQLLSEGLEEACQHYEKNYLQGSLYAATLQKAMVRLLELLEVPGIAESLVRVRQVLTWPARKLRGVFFNGGSILERKTEKLDAEREILKDALSQLIISLQHTAGQNLLSENAHERQWWVNVFNAIEEQASDITETFDRSVEQYQQEFAVEIEAAAQKLYEHLKENPAMLNSLRAARVTTDAAAVVFALKTGGIGLNDLVLTPAMLSFVSMLTEGALGKYMQGVQTRLKQSQKEAVCHLLIQEKLNSRLKKIESQMSKKGLYNIQQSTLAEVEKALAV